MHTTHCRRHRDEPMLMINELENSAKTCMTQAFKDAQVAAFEAGLAVPFLDEKYIERRRQHAQNAQVAALEAADHARMAEQKFYEGRYVAAIDACDHTRKSAQKAQEEARLAAIDESELYQCPSCMSRVGRFSARAELISPLPDGTQLWAKRFQCSNCNTRWREVCTDANILIERIIE